MLFFPLPSARVSAHEIFFEFSSCSGGDIWRGRDRGTPLRVLRGGSWNNNGNNSRSANRNRNTPDNINNNLGFRLVSASTP
ncbi:MAG TPA: SUMF1/EgtB/PvdO family nonheme iron enzyme, partial [Blastocatellia bacterium]|nr:SUMF1/EgtB/PvdO family nonheme iron enzyme [Blastocatellia bacterium]